MRITNSVLVNNLKNNLSRNIRLLGKIQLQLETGRRISKPSIDPTGIVESLRLTTRLKENEQYRNNVEDALGWLNTTDDALGALNSVIQRIYELTVQGANGPLDVEERHSICEEVKQLRDEMGEIANTTHGDRYIFGGTNTTEKPYSDGTWQHNSKSIRYEVGIGVEIPINLTAEEVFVEAELMPLLDQVITDLENDDYAALSSERIGELQTAIEHVLACRAKVGASVNRLEMTKARLEEQEINFEKLLADVDGVDPAWVIMQLKEQESVYRASLAVGARVIMPTLVDFIR